MLRVHTLIVVAGVVRLTIVRAPARSRRTVAVIDAADRIGTGWSSRNSEVIHAGIDYATGSLRARLRVEGRHRLYAYCALRGIAHRCTGKLIVATEPTHARPLAQRRDEAMANSVEQIGWLAGIDGADPTTIACAFGEIR